MRFSSPKMRQIQNLQGLCPDPAGDRAYSALLSWWKGARCSLLKNLRQYLVQEKVSNYINGNNLRLLATV